MRSVGKIERDDWNMKEIERKIMENRLGRPEPKTAERVPKWDREQVCFLLLLSVIKRCLIHNISLNQRTKCITIMSPVSNSKKTGPPVSKTIELTKILG